MSDGRWGDVAAAAQQGPPDADREGAWARAVARRRRWLVLTSAGLLVACTALVAVLSAVHHAPPTRYAWLLLAVVVLTVGASLWPLRDAAARARWEENARRQVRIDTALHEHASIGAGDREQVTEQAELRRSLGTVAVIGYPLLALFVAFLLVDANSVPGFAALPGTAVAVVLCGLGLLRSRRRADEARRWLAEPLPPGR